MPTLPPAPATFVTCTLRAILAVVSACCIERAVWSHPPPGAAGAMIFSSSCCERAGALVARVNATTAPNRREGNEIMGLPPGSRRATLCQFAAYQPEKPPLSRRTVGRQLKALQFEALAYC